MWYYYVLVRVRSSIAQQGLGKTAIKEDVEMTGIEFGVIVAIACICAIMELTVFYGLDAVISFLKKITENQERMIDGQKIIEENQEVMINLLQKHLNP